VVIATWKRLLATPCACSERWIGIPGATKFNAATKEEARMALNLSIAQMLAQLEAKVALHRERKNFHADQEAIHREQTALHTSELDNALARLEAFRSAAEAAGELLEDAKLAALPPAQPDLDDADLIRKRSLSRMVARVVEGIPADQTFGAHAVTRQIQERWGAKLRRRPDPRSVAAGPTREASPPPSAAGP